MKNLAEIVTVLIAEHPGELSVAVAAGKKRRRLFHALLFHVAHDGIVRRTLEFAAEMPFAYIQRGADILERKVLAQVGGDPLFGALRQIFLRGQTVSFRGDALQQGTRYGGVGAILRGGQLTISRFRPVFFRHENAIVFQALIRVFD